EHRTPQIRGRAPRGADAVPARLAPQVRLRRGVGARRVLEHHASGGELRARRQRSRCEGVVLATGDRLPAHAHVACLSRRGGGHGRALARQLSRAGGYPARAWLVPSGGLSAEPRPLRTSRPGGVRRLAAQDECAVRRAHVGAARLQLTRGSAVAPERALQAEGGTANGEPDRLRRSVPTAADQPARTCAEARLYVYA